MIRLLKAWTRIALGVAKAASGRYEAATADRDEAIRLQTGLFRGPTTTGATPSMRRGKHEAATPADYDEAIRLQLDFSEAYNNRGFAKEALGRYEAAIADHDEAIRLQPDFSGAYNNRGVAKAALGHPEAAIADYDEAIRLQPDDAEAYNNRGFAKGTSSQSRDTKSHLASKFRDCDHQTFSRKN